MDKPRVGQVYVYRHNERWIIVEVQDQNADIFMRLMHVGRRSQFVTHKITWPPSDSVRRTVKFDEMTDDEAILFAQATLCPEMFVRKD